MSYFAVYSPDRSTVVCMSKSPQYDGVSSTYSWNRDVNDIGPGLKIRVLKSRKGQEPYRSRASERCEEEYQILETNENGIVL